MLRKSICYQIIIESPYRHHCYDMQEDAAAARAELAAVQCYVTEAQETAAAAEARRAEVPASAYLIFLRISGWQIKASSVPGQVSPVLIW